MGYESQCYYYMSDIAAAGIPNVTVAPIVYGWIPYSLLPNTTVGVGLGCNPGSTPETIYFEGTVPFGQVLLSGSVTGAPDGFEYNPAYNTCNSNPYFVGWPNIMNVINTALSAAHSHLLTVSELDWDTEMDLLNYTVQGRLIYDTTNSYDVFSALQGAMSAYGYDPSKGIQVNVTAIDPGALLASTNSATPDLSLGVFRANGAYIAAVPAPSSGGAIEYTLTIPADEQLQLWVHSRTLSLQNSDGTPISAQGQRAPIPIGAAFTSTIKVVGLIH